MRRSMPWYCYPKLTCRVLNRLASRVIDREVCKDVMEQCTMMLWNKLDNYYRNGGYHAQESR